MLYTSSSKGTALSRLGISLVATSSSTFYRIIRAGIGVFSLFAGKKKAHKHKLFGPVALGTPRVCPRDKVGLSQGQTQLFSLFYTAEAQFVPGTNPVCPWDIPGTKGGRKSLCVKSLCASFVPYFRPEKSHVRAQTFGHNNPFPAFNPPRKTQKSRHCTTLCL